MEDTHMIRDLRDIYDRWLEEIELDLLLTKQCNLNCIHCFLDTKCGEMSFDTLRKITNDALLTSYSQRRKRSINLSGGEIFLRKDIKEIFALFKGLNVSVGCVSNGFFITEQIVDLMLENQIGLSLSMDGINETHNRYRQSDIAFNRLEEAIDKLTSKKAPFSVICSVSKLNIDHIREIIEYCISKKIRSIRFQVVKPEGNALLMQDRNLILDDYEKQRLFEELIGYCGKYVSDISISGYGSFKSELREHGCKFGLKWGKTCHSNSTPWPKSFGIDTDGYIMQMHPFHKNSFWQIGHIDEGLHNVISRYYASEKHLDLLKTLRETYEDDILKSSEEFIFEDMYLENKVTKKLSDKHKEADGGIIRTK